MIDDHTAALGALRKVASQHNLEVPAQVVDLDDDESGVEEGMVLVSALHITAGHTDGDSVIYFPQSNVVHMGDDFVTYGFPFIDLESGGSVKGMIANVAKLLEQIPADAKIIPGHGKIATVKELREYLAMLKGTSAIVEAGIKAGKTADQLKKEKALAKYDAWGKGFFKPEEFIDQLYKDLKR